MKASELRIGNLIKFNNFISKEELVVVNPRFFGSAMCSEDFEINQYYKPIPLTEEWLIKFGFEKVDHKTGIICSYKKKGIRIDISNSGNTYYKHKPVPYVHKLQNLFFELKDEELKIKQ